MKNLKCAQCEYDLRGQPIGSNCPECGMEVRTSRAIHRAGWTFAIGIRRGLLWLAVSMVICTPITLGYFWFIGPLGSVFWRGRLALFLAAPLTIPLVWLFWYCYRNRVGFDGPVVVFTAIGGVAAATTLGARVAIHLALAPSGLTTLVGFVVVGLSALWIACSELSG